MVDDLLSVRDLTKRYAVTVLDRASLDLRGGEIHALLGANGAGKSTMCRIIAGLVKPTVGTMTLAGQTYLPANKQAAEAAGVQIVQQELNLIPTLSVAENVMLGRMPNRLGLINRRRLHDRARAALDQFALQDIDADTVAGSLGVGRQQMVEIATALDRDCRLLILDEPTAALSGGEAETLFQWLDKLRSQGVGMIYISHRLDEVARIADRVTVLRDGRTVCTRDTATLTTDEMVGLMTGEGNNDHRGEDHRSFATDTPALRVEGLSRSGVVRDVSLAVYAGQRLGIAGLVGAGRTELLRLIFGADQADSGRIFLRNESTPRRFRHPSEAVEAGIAMVTEDRKENGLLLTQSVRVNTTLAALKTRFSARGLVRSRIEHRAVIDICERMETRCTSIEQTAGTLSGGNQQKVAVARWLMRDADVYLFDEPTRGIDVAARRRIYRLFCSLAENGKALVIVSSDVDELLETCDLIAVMSLGKLVRVFSRADASEERIMQAAFAEHVNRN
jgi:ribose transport system ATP-binding protein